MEAEEIKPPFQKYSLLTPAARIAIYSSDPHEDESKPKDPKGFEMKDMWVGFMVVMLTILVCFGLVYGQIADIRESIGRIDATLSGIKETIARIAK